MIIYKIGPRGGLSKIRKGTFNNDEIFLVDDYKTLYLWYGNNTSEKAREIAFKKAEKLRKERKLSSPIQVNHQSKEYGSFLVIKDLLEKGTPVNQIKKERGELEIQIEDTLEFMEAGLELDLEGMITLKAHELFQEGKSYEELCTLLAQLQLFLLKGKATEKEIREKAREILKSSATYEELCWLISEIKILSEKNKHEF
ncbi:MAG: hypothetical protein ACTSU4_02770 [Promethearchaeota archaeon]